MSSFQNNWEQILKDDYDANFDHIRFICASLLPKEVKGEVDEILARTRSTEDTFNLPCKCRPCSTVEEAKHCNKWSEDTVLTTIIRKILAQGELDEDGFCLLNAIFWYIYASAYERWEDSFDYITINCQLHVARQLISSVKKESDNPLPEYQAILTSMEYLSLRIHHCVLVENSMITNNAKSMLFHATKASEYSGKIKKKLEGKKGSVDWIQNYSDDLFEKNSEYNLYDVRLQEIVRFIEMRQENPKQFLIDFPKAHDDLKTCLADIEKEKNFENASEYRAHLRCLELHQKQLHVPQLKLEHIQGSLSYAFYLNLSGLNVLCHPETGNTIKKEEGNNKQKEYPQKAAESLIEKGDQVERASKVLESISEKLKEGKGNLFCLKDEIVKLGIEGVGKDPAPDILDYSIGAEHFQNIQINFSEIEVRNLKCEPAKEEQTGEILLTLKPKLMHYALGMGCLEFSIDEAELSIPQFHALKNLAAPHSGQYEFRIKPKNNPGGKNENIKKEETGAKVDKDKNDNEGEQIFWAPTLKILAREIIESYRERLIEFIDEVGKTAHKNENGEEQKKSAKDNEIQEQLDLEKREAKKLINHSLIEIEHSWFANISVYRITDIVSGITYRIEDLLNHWEYPGLIAYPRADKASIDDWVDIKVDALKINNMAQIRAHKGDLFVVGENHAISYFPDDPHFIVKQYEETAKWVFLIQSLAKSTLRDCQKAVKEFDDEHILENFMKSPERTLTPAQLMGHQLKLQKMRMAAIHAVDHVSAIYISQYADHTLLLKEAFTNSGANNIISALRSKISDLDEILKSVDLIMRHFQDDHEKKRDRKINIAILILGLTQIILVADIFYKVTFTNTGDDSRFSFPTLVDYGWFICLMVVGFLSFRFILTRVLIDDRSGLSRNRNNTK
ncbi:MAG: hypothetical protein NTW10_12430 [Bacteroidetes bacterium]|nr:hypothetical protein [Bacteroidota bacterium]